MARKPDLQGAYALQTPQDNLRLYADWADTYDSDFAERMQFLLPGAVARAYAGAGGQGPVIDLGAGTGLCGAALAGLGIGPVEATDLSPDMLEVAGSRNIYARLFQGDLLGRLPVAENSYAGAVSSGTFTHGHVGPDALGEVIRILRPGGLAVLSVNAEHWQALGFAEALAALGPAITGLRHPIAAIYGDGAKGEDHADDLAHIVQFRVA